jgi:hypothetical protein
VFLSYQSARFFQCGGGAQVFPLHLIQRWNYACDFTVSRHILDVYQVFCRRAGCAAQHSYAVCA